MADAGAARERSKGIAASRLISRLLRVPLFYKILIANGALFVLGAAIGIVLAVPMAAGDRGALRLALRPLELHEETALRVREGDWTARVPESALADRDMDRLTRVFNDMLDDVSVYRARLRDVAARALRAEEEERRRISRELHDDTAQVLTALLLRLRLVQRTDNPARQREMLGEMRADLAEAVEGVRRLAAGLRPPPLDELGLAAAIEKYAEDACRSYDVSLDLDLTALRRRFPPDVELALYRIAQEALSNAARHAAATRVAVQATSDGDELVLLVDDDGQGFDVAVRSEEARGLGITGMMERASYMGAVVMIDSTIGEGTCVRAVVPLPPEAT
jgi:two-component system sensor histidine kinase UhpB